MRLICPECAAQYAVEDRMIPKAGREVQCSSCGHRWFQEAIAAPASDTLATPETETALTFSPDTPEEFVRRPIDPKVLAILREEADRERSAREVEQAVRTGGDDVGSPQKKPAKPAPDKPSEPDTRPAEPTPDPVPDEKKGFGLGAWLAVLVFLGATLAYVFAEPIAVVVPALAEPIASYVTAVDSGRLWLGETWADLTGTTAPAE